MTTHPAWPGGPPERWKPRFSASCARRGGPLSPGEVRQRVSAGRRGELSYSTIVTIVSRLHDKGLLARQRAGRGFTYTPVDEASLAASRMSQALGSGIDRDAVLSRFASGLSGRDARLLRRLLTNGQEPAAGGQDQTAGGQEATAGDLNGDRETGVGACGCFICRW